MTIKHEKKTYELYELELSIPVKINEDAELELIQDSIAQLREVFARHPQKPLKESLLMLGNPSRYARVLGLLEEALKNAKTISYVEEI